MALQPGILTPIDTGITFADDLSSKQRILHNGSNILALDTSTNAITYYTTNGIKGNTNILATPSSIDIYYDRGLGGIGSNRYLYTLGYKGIETTTTTQNYNSSVVTTATGAAINPNDDFSSNTGFSFDLTKWIEISGYSSFIRDQDTNSLLFRPIAQPSGLIAVLSTSAQFSGTTNISLDYTIDRIGSNGSSFGMNFNFGNDSLDTYGVGITDSGSYCFSTGNVINATNGAYLRNLRYLSPVNLIISSKSKPHGNSWENSVNNNYTSYIGCSALTSGISTWTSYYALETSPYNLVPVSSITLSKIGTENNLTVYSGNIAAYAKGLNLELLQGYFNTTLETFSGTVYPLTTVSGSYSGNITLSGIYSQCISGTSVTSGEENYIITINTSNGNKVTPTGITGQVPFYSVVGPNGDNTPSYSELLSPTGVYPIGSNGLFFTVTSGTFYGNVNDEVIYDLPCLPSIVRTSIDTTPTPLFTVDIIQRGNSVVIGDNFSIDSSITLRPRTTTSTGTITLCKINGNCFSPLNADFSRILTTGNVSVDIIGTVGQGSNIVPMYVYGDNFTVTSGYDLGYIPTKVTTSSIEYDETLTTERIKLSIDELNSDGSLRSNKYTNIQLYPVSKITSNKFNINTNINTTSGIFTSPSYFNSSLNTVSGLTPTFNELKYLANIVVNSGVGSLILKDSVYRISLTGTSTITGNITDITPGITSTSGIISYPFNSFNYNTTSSGFLHYCSYSPTTSVTTLKTLNYTNPPASSQRAVYLQTTSGDSINGPRMYIYNPDNSSIYYTTTGTKRQMQFNIDPLIAAFSSINLDDATLRAGTSDYANVTVEVINAWGDPLANKTVNYQVIQGDGIVNPVSAITNSNGIAVDSYGYVPKYNVGNTAGLAKIQVTISDT